MSTVDSPLTKSDFEQCDWQNLLGLSVYKTCSSYSSLFFNKADEAKSTGNLKTQQVFALLGTITYPRLIPHDSKNTFVNHEIFANLSSEHLSIFADLAPEVADAEIRARLADILWIRKHSTRLPMARLAIDSYLESATVLEDPVNWVECVLRIERAVQLAAFLDKKVKGPYYSKAISHVENVLAKYNGDDPLFLSIELIEVLQEQKAGDFEQYAELAHKIAMQAEAKHNWHKARHCLLVQSKWYSLAAKPQEAQATKIECAETYVKEAQERLNGPEPRYNLASQDIRSAIKALRNWGGKAERIKELERLLIDYQAKSRSELKRMAVSIDVGDLSERARDQVKGKTRREAIIALALIGLSPTVSTLRKQVEDAVQQFPLQHLLVVELTNEMGKTIGNRASLPSEDPVTVEVAIRAEMFSRARQHHNGHAFITVEPARMQVSMEHLIRIEDLLPFVTNNPFVPQGREHIYARGLHAGFTGDFLVAAHLLLPQVENSIRYLLYQQGHVVSNLTSQNIQNELDLNTAYEKFREEITTVLG
ncbi:MAG TPA: hypothetical protein VFV38_01855, partial [Ktedonobacteraceae bacterium]|nr:hypothetical protein [Ktedonobacteraceae bacterium]